MCEVVFVEIVISRKLLANRNLAFSTEIAKRNKFIGTQISIVIGVRVFLFWNI